MELFSRQFCRGALAALVQGALLIILILVPLGLFTVLVLQPRLKAEWATRPMMIMTGRRRVRV